jgi:hypothetical protein
MALSSKSAEADRLARVHRLQDEVAALPVLDARSADEIIGYDDHALPA